jgi:hypothetical protein
MVAPRLPLAPNLTRRANLGWRQVAAVAIVRQGAQEGEGAGDVVVGHDQRQVQPSKGRPR